MRTATPTQVVEMFLCVLYEGTESGTPWVDNHPVEWEVEELACRENGPRITHHVLRHKVIAR